MTNRERWNLYTENLVSPDNYIAWSFRYLIAAALQRRVWIGPTDYCRPDNQAIFSNMYVVLVGPPGTGKGLPIKEISLFLRHWKLRDSIKLEIPGLTKQEQATAEAVKESDLVKAQQVEQNYNDKTIGAPEPLLIPIAADATTYEALVEAVGRSYRRINFIETNGDGSRKYSIYGHSSICFILPELASLLRKRTDDTVNYMLGLYDCPAEYEYVTKTKGKDRVKHGCLNLLAGTTPSFMQSIFNSELVDEGFSSRTFFIYASKNRKSVMFLPDLTTEQKQARTDLLTHIRNLTCLYGPLQVSKDTMEWISTWWQEYNNQPRSNSSAKMLPYYGRKNIHVVKVAIANHFMESTDMTISREEFEKAIEDLADEERRMHLAITMEASNKLSNVAKKVMEYLKVGRKNFVDLHVETYEMATREQLEEAITFLIETNQIRQTGDDNNVAIYERKELE